MTEKKKIYLEWAISFWMGVGLMSIINVWKLVYTETAIPYSGIMFGVSIIFIIICVLLLIKRKK